MNPRRTLGNPRIPRLKMRLILTLPISLSMHPLTRPSSIVIGMFLMLMSAHAQDENRKEKYIESNWGIAAVQFIIDEGPLPFPGTSVLFGSRKFYSNDTFLDTQIGLAFPSILTGKIGYGKRFTNGESLTAGIRVFPTHLFLTTGIPRKNCHRDISDAKLRRLAKRGKTAADIKCSEWVFSVEASPLLAENFLPDGISDELNLLTFTSTFMISIGHRWMY